MAKTKKEEVKKIEEVEVEAPSKAEYRKILEAYALAYPEKWEARKERLLARLAAIK